MTVKITENPQVSQPGPFSRGQTAVVADSGIEVEQKGGNMFLFAPGVALDDIVKSVNALGASPGDLVAIRSEEHTSELQSLMRRSYAVFCLQKKTHIHQQITTY